MSRNSGGSPPGARRTPHDDFADDEESFVTEGGCDVVYRRAEVAQHISQGAVAEPSHDMASSMPKSHPLLSWESSGETVPSWSGVSNASMQKHAPVEHHQHGGYIGDHRGNVSMGSGYMKSDPYATKTSLGGVAPAPNVRGLGNNSGMTQGRVSPMSSNSPFEDVYEPSPSYWSPFGPDAVDDDADDNHPEGTPRVSSLPSTFRLERTNFTARGEGSERPAIEKLIGALTASLEAAAIDVLEFRNGDCVFECSYHQGNRYLSLWLRVFLPPNPKSSQMHSNEKSASDGQENAYLVEAQLREGDRLHFSAVFRDLMKMFKTQEGMSIGGTYRYQPRVAPAVGEGLVLEEPSFSPSRQSIRLLAEQNELLNAAAHPASARRMLAQGMAGGGPADSLGSPPPLPPGMMTETAEELDGDTVDDVILLADMLKGTFLDVQADAATAVAGITADDTLLQSLSKASAAGAATALSSASARLLVETRHRPARRQAAVVVANLSTTATLRTALLASDPPSRFVGSGVGGIVSHGGLVEALVGLAMGRPHEGGVKKEEEIGTRRECMRALVNFAGCRAVRTQPSMLSLLSCEPTGRGESDLTLQARLRACRELLKGPSPPPSP